MRCRVSVSPELDETSTLEFPVYTEWPYYGEPDRLCKNDETCADYLGEGYVHKCGSLADYGLPLELDMPVDQEQIFFDIIGFNHLAQGMVTIF